MRVFARALLALALLAAPASADTLTPRDMRANALAAVASGQPRAAIALADALLGRDPGDVTALLIRSRAWRDLGDYRQASRDAQAAWRAADGDAERYRAALSRAQALASDGKRTRAQLWLRRAVEAAPDDRRRAAAARDFAFVRARNPLSLRFSLDIAPTSNANNGSTSEVAELFGLPFRLSGASLALSGVKFAGGAALGYRLAEDANSRDDLALTLFHQTYRLSDEAREIAPDAEGSDFAYSAVSLGYSRLWTPGPGAGFWRMDAVLGTNAYGGDALSHFLRAGLGRTVALGPRSTARLRVEGEVQDRQTGQQEMVRALSFEAELTRRLRRGDRARIGAEVTFSRSDDISFDYRAGVLTGGYHLGQPVMGAEIGLRAQVSVTDFEASAFRAGGRLDRAAEIGVEMAFPDLARYGFAPVVGLDGAWRDSDVDLYDTETLGVRLGFKSVF